MTANAKNATEEMRNKLRWEQISKNHFLQVKKYSLKKFRRQNGKTIVEGIRSLKQIADNGSEFEEIYATASINLENLRASRYFLLEKWQLEKIVSTQTPQDIAALIEIKNKPLKERDFLLYLDGIKEPGNLGTIVRTAFAAGISGIVLSPNCCELFSPKVVRASLGTVFSIPIEIRNYDWLKNQKAKIIATKADAETDISHFQKPDENIILVIGSEAFGVSEEILQIANYVVKISMNNKVESLNAAVAAGIMMFHLR